MSDQETNTDSKRGKREREEKEESQVQEEEDDVDIGPVLPTADDTPKKKKRDEYFNNT